MSASLGYGKLKKRRCLQLQDMRNVSTLERTFESRKHTLMRKALQLEQACGVEVLVTVKMKSNVTYYYCSNIKTIEHLKSCGVIGDVSQNAAEVLMVLPDPQVDTMPAPRGEKERRKVLLKENLLVQSPSVPRKAGSGSKKIPTSQNNHQTSNEAKKLKARSEIYKKTEKTSKPLRKKSKQNLILLKSSTHPTKEIRQDRDHCNDFPRVLAPLRGHQAPKPSPDISLFVPVAPPKPRPVARVRPSLNSDVESTSDDDSDDSSDDSDLEAEVSESRSAKAGFHKSSLGGRKRLDGGKHSASLPTTERKRCRSLSMVTVKPEKRFSASTCDSTDPFPVSATSASEIVERTSEADIFRSKNSNKCVAPSSQASDKDALASSIHSSTKPSYCTSTFTTQSERRHKTALLPPCPRSTANPSRGTRLAGPPRLHLLTTLCSKPSLDGSHSSPAQNKHQSRHKNATENSCGTISEGPFLHPVVKKEIGDLSSRKLTSTDRDFSSCAVNREANSMPENQKRNRSSEVKDSGLLFVIDKTKSTVGYHSRACNETPSTCNELYAGVKTEKLDGSSASCWPLGEIEKLHGLENQS